MLWERDQEKSSNLPLFVDKALKLFNLHQVAFEIETSVMSKVSCTACQAGKRHVFVKSMQISTSRINSRCRIIATLHTFWQIRERNQENHLPILCQFENTIFEGLRRHHRIICRRSHLRLGKSFNRYKNV